MHSASGVVSWNVPRKGSCPTRHTSLPSACSTTAMTRRSAPRRDDSLFQFPRGWLRKFQPALVRWYAERARPLPWRDSRDPYRIWVSEVMLQQTTVTAVIPYFERFLARFPTVSDLARAPEDEVLKQWEGLGYYSRARNLQKAAKRIVASESEGGLDGHFPTTVEGWTALPGIGRYTAGAIVGFAFDLPAPIVEANTQRLYARLMGYSGDLKTAAGQRALWDFAERIVPVSAPGLFNQALMELGSLVCRPVAPECSACPVIACCRAAADGSQAEIPLPAKRPAITDRAEYAVVVERGGQCLLMRWNPGERWAGLWDFVRFGEEAVLEGVRPAPQPSDLAVAVERIAGVRVEVRDCFHELTHGVTRYRIHLRVHAATMKSENRPGKHDDGHHRSSPGAEAAVVGGRETAWVSFDELSEYPLSVSARKIADLIVSRRRGLFHSAW